MDGLRGLVRVDGDDCRRRDNDRRDVYARGGINFATAAASRLFQCSRTEKVSFNVDNFISARSYIVPIDRWWSFELKSCSYSADHNYE